MRVAIIDYGLSNLFSVERACETVGLEVTIVRRPEEMQGFTHAILPGVGAFPEAMQALTAHKLDDAIRSFVSGGGCLFGVCLGMQLLFDSSDEFKKTPGLGLLPGNVERIPATDSTGATLRVPHMGWNALHPGKGRDKAAWSSTPLHDLKDGDFVYFVHSYRCLPADEGDVLATTDYGGHEIAAAVFDRKSDGRVSGCQFHPEKSGEAGIGIYKRWAGTASAK